MGRVQSFSKTVSLKPKPRGGCATCCAREFYNDLVPYQPDHGMALIVLILVSRVASGFRVNPKP